MLLSGLILRILYSLIRRKFLPYPSLAELRDHRSEMERADKFSRAVVTRLAAAPSSAEDMFTVFKELRAMRKRQVAAKKAKAAQKGAEKPQEDEGQVEGDEQTVPDVAEDNHPPEEEDVPAKATKEEADAKRNVLRSLNDVADIHERIKKCARTVHEHHLC